MCVGFGFFFGGGGDVGLRPVSCVLNVNIVSGLSILDFPFRFH